MDEDPYLALEKAFRLTRQMERAHNISTRAAQTDELTGLMNRRAFFEHFGEQLYDTVIPRNIRLAEAPSYGMPALREALVKVRKVVAW